MFAKQAEFYRQMSGMIRAAKTDGSAVWTLLGISFVYGIFHAAGPGHGKAVISSYLVANEETWRRGVVLSFASALLQAFVAVAIVGIAAVVLNATAGQMCRRGARDRDGELRADRAGRRAPDLGQGQGLPARGAKLKPAAARGRRRGDAHDHHAHITIMTTIHARSSPRSRHASRSWARSSSRRRRHASAWGHAHGPEPEELAGPGGWKRGLSAIVAVGLRPCSGAIIVLVFALAQGLFWAGVAATFVMGLGTAITVAGIATLAVGARSMAKQIADTRSGYGMLALRGIEVGAAVLVLCFGTLLLLGYMVAERGACF